MTTSTLRALVEATRALVATDTQNPPGNERLAADVARQLLEPFGATFSKKSNPSLAASR